MTSSERKSVRLESDQFISYRIFDADDRVCDEGMAKTRDISRNGVAIENRHGFELGARAELTIALVDDLIKTGGVVRNVTKVDDQTYHIGIEFTKISEEEIQKLSKEFPSILE